jgi:RHS repeat-associated protein
MTCDPTANGFVVTTLYELGPNGAPMTEVDNGSWSHTDVYAGGLQVATYDGNGVHFQIHDWLGTRRVQTNYAGVVEDACSSNPYGDGQTCSNAVMDTSDVHFTGKPRDQESGLDFFDARHYASSMGRFSSPDPSGLTYADPTNPQSFNLYSYVFNDPLVNIDPTGLKCQKNSTDGTVYDDMDGTGCEVVDQQNADDLANGRYSAMVMADWGRMVTLSASAGNLTQHVAPSKGPCTVSGPSKIYSASYTFSLAGAGTAIGSLFGPEGTVIGAAIGNSIGVGLGGSYVPATKSLYIGPAAAFSPFGGGGFNANYVNVPAGQNPNAIASGQSYSVTFQPLPFLGSTVVKSPGSAPVVGPSIGTRVPVSAGASYNFCVHNCGC